MRRIAQREALRVVALRDGELLEDRGEDEWPELQANRSEERIDVRRALRALPPHERQVLYLHYWHDMRCRDVAAALDLPIGTVKIRLSRGRSRLSARLSDGGA